jgi:hypothetical protein
MSNDQKSPTPSPQPDKKSDKVNDLPARDAGSKDDQVKGGRMKLDPTK